MLIPTSCAALGLRATALIAVPILVLKTANSRATMRTAATTMTMTWFIETMSPWTSISLAGKMDGNALGVAPKTSCPEYSRNSDIPIAVMRTLSVGPDRSGRYTSRSMPMPRSAPPAIAAATPIRPPPPLPPGEVAAHVVADERSHHEHVRVREINEPKDAVDHRVAERDQGVDGPEREPV